MKVALTGGASGIGAAVAAELTAKGHSVTVFDIHEPQAGAEHWIKVDLSDFAAIDAAIEAADGPFDALINNAGLPPRDGLAELVLRVNFFGLRRFMHGLTAQLGEGASIVNVASRAGSFWRENLDEVKALMSLDPEALSDFVTDRNIDATRAYNLSKEAVIVMTMAETQRKNSQGLRINSVSPAAVETDILSDFATAFGDKMTKNVARVGRAGTVSEIAAVIVFLASPESGWIKGQDIVIDGE
ncbi:MAG: SDR family oxidoreductase [Pseudomonadota bacterium]